MADKRFPDVDKNDAAVVVAVLTVAELHVRPAAVGLSKVCAQTSG